MTELTTQKQDFETQVDNLKTKLDDVQIERKRFDKKI